MPLLSGLSTGVKHGTRLRARAIYAGGGRDPADHFAVMAIKGEGEAHDLAVPAGELQAIRAPADI